MESSNKSIINWELHQKLSKKTKIQTKYKYYKPNGKKPSWFKRFISHMKKVFKGLNNMRKNGNSPRS
jgi:hypothetical protein